MSKPTTVQYTGKYANHLLREKDKEIERLNNIIKEVREYVEENLCYSTCDGMKYTIPSGKDILEILDKGE